MAGYVVEPPNFLTVGQLGNSVEPSAEEKTDVASHFLKVCVFLEGRALRARHSISSLGGGSSLFLGQLCRQSSYRPRKRQTSTV